VQPQEAVTTTRKHTFVVGVVFGGSGEDVGVCCVSECCGRRGDVIYCGRERCGWDWDNGIVTAGSLRVWTKRIWMHTMRMEYRR